MPHDFELNNGHVDAQIPSQQGGNMLAKWIKVLRSGEVVARVGEDPDKPEYVVPLHLATDYSPGDVDTMPYWCEELLQSNRAAFFALATTVHALDLTASAEVECYHHHHERRAQLKANQHAIIAEIEREDEELTSICHCLEGWRLYEQVGHLQYCHDLIRERTPFHTLCRYYPRRARPGAGPGGPARGRGDVTA
jgi:hypothetical protein